jgi:hypothetical protein
MLQAQKEAQTGLRPCNHEPGVPSPYSLSNKRCGNPLPSLIFGDANVPLVRTPARPNGAHENPFRKSCQDNFFGRAVIQPARLGERFESALLDFFFERHRLALRPASTAICPPVKNTDAAATAAATPANVLAHSGAMTYRTT